MEFDIFSTVSLTEALNQKLPAKRFLAQTFFGIKFWATQQVGLDTVNGSRRIAPFVRPHQKGTAVKGASVTTRMFTPSQINLYTRTEAVDAYKRAPGETISYANGQVRKPEDVAGDMIGNDQRDLVNMSYRTIEKMCADAMFTGVVTMRDENGAEIDHVDLGLKVSHNLTLSNNTGWNKSGTDPLKNLRDWKRTVVKDSGLNAGIVVMGSKAYDAFISNASVKEYLNLRNITLGAVKPGEESNGATLMGNVEGLDIWVYDEWYIDPATGNEVSVVPEEKVCVVARDIRATVHFGAIADVEAGNFMGEFFSRIYNEPDGSARYVQVRSAPLSVVEQIDGLLVVDVIEA